MDVTADGITFRGADYELTLAGVRRGRARARMRAGEPLAQAPASQWVAAGRAAGRCSRGAAVHHLPSWRPVGLR